jgi:hypothetical protein
MSSAQNQFQPSSKTTYIATDIATGSLYSYTTSRNTTTYAIEGTLSSQSVSILAGTLLRENGKRLFPGANPGITTMMVGVFNSDVVPPLSGFIDPNSLVYAVFNANKPVTIPNGTDIDGVGALHSGNPVITDGVVDAGNFIVRSGELEIPTSTGMVSTTTLSAGTRVITIPNLTANAQIFVTNRTTAANGIRAVPTANTATFTGTGTDSFCYFIVNPYS